LIGMQSSFVKRGSPVLLLMKSEKPFRQCPSLRRKGHGTRCFGVGSFWRYLPLGSFRWGATHSLKLGVLEASASSILFVLVSFFPFELLTLLMLVSFASLIISLVLYGCAIILG
jgi:hypothetical protein